MTTVPPRLAKEPWPSRGRAQRRSVRARLQGVLFALTLGSACGLAAAAGPERTAPGMLALDGVTVVDTYTGKLTPNMVVLIDGAKIIQIVPHGSPALQGPIQTVAAQGKFVVPGFLDMHLHVLQEEYPEDAYRLLLANGVTGWRQMSGSPQLLQQRKEGKLGLGPDVPELLAMPGTILTADLAGSPDAARAEVRKQKAAGADFIKTVFVPPKAFFAVLDEAQQQGLPVAGHLSPGVFPDRASEAGMRAIEHLGPTELELMACSKYSWLLRAVFAVHSPKPPDLSPDAMARIGKLLITNPVIGLLEINPDTFKNMQRMLDSFRESKLNDLAKTFIAHETWQVPTLIRLRTQGFGDSPEYTGNPNLRYVPKYQRDYWASVGQLFTQRVPASGREALKQEAALQLKMVKLYDQAGVPMLAGSDGGGWLIPGFSLHQEFDLLAQAGLTPLKVLQMTTLNGAKFVHREATMGSVAAGKQADLVLLDANPLDSVQNFHRIAGVVRSGRYYSKAALEDLKKQVADHVTAIGDAPAPTKTFAP